MTMNAFKHFDLPVKHLDTDFDYVPPKARNQEEIERRRSLPPGTVLAEAQTRGVEIACRVIDYCVEHDDGEYSARLLAATAMNTAWYNFARDARTVMRRRLYLPIHGKTDPITRESLLTRASKHMHESAEQAHRVQRSIEGRHCTTTRFKKDLGIKLGDTSLVLASVERATEIEMARGESALAQRITREACLEALEQSRILYSDMHSNPTLAQLADSDSPLSVHWRRTAPNEALDALEFATNS